MRRRDVCCDGTGCGSNCACWAVGHRGGLSLYSRALRVALTNHKVRTSRLGLCVSNACPSQQLVKPVRGSTARRLGVSKATHQRESSRPGGAGAEPMQISHGGEFASTTSHHSHRCTGLAGLQINNGNAIESRRSPMSHFDEVKPELQPPARLQTIQK